MFGITDYSREYDRRNPRCAEIFHVIVDQFYRLHGHERSRFFFKDKTNRDELDADYNRIVVYLETFGDRQTCYTIHKDLEIITYSYASGKGDLNQAICGIMITICNLRSMIFSYGPAFARVLQVDPYDATLRTCKIMTMMFGSSPAARLEKIKSARTLWNMFYEECCNCYRQPYLNGE